jgi:GAF domain-containing protein
LQVAGQWLGYIDAIYTATVVLPEEEMRRLLALASQAAAAVQGLHLLRQAEIRAQRERVLREITARVHSATDLEVIMKTAVREVSRALGRDAFLTLGEPPARTNGSSIEGSTMERST